MASFGYYVYLLRAAKPFNSGQLYRLSEVGDAGDDLLTVMHKHLTAMGTGYHSQAETGEGYRFRATDIAGRTMWVRVNRGPEGVPGETWDRDTNTGRDTSERVALLSGLRAMFVVPEDAYFGLLFVEKVGVRHLKDLLQQTATQPGGQVVGAHVTLESFAELKDWQRELEPLAAVRISESLAVRASGEDASTRQDTVVNIVATGGAVARATDRVKRIFYDRINRRDRRLEVLKQSSQLGERRRAAEADGVTFQEESEYQEQLKVLRDLNRKDEYEPELAEVVSEVVPVDRESAEHKSFSVALGDERPRRTIAIEGTAIPQFKYELGGRLTDGGLRNTWTDHAESILKVRGVTLPRGWATK